MAEYRHLSMPDPEWKQFPNNLPPGTRITRLSRDRLPIAPDPSLEIDEINVPLRDGTTMIARYYRRKVIEQHLPVFVYMHGGGYITGGLESEDWCCRAIAAACHVVVLSLEYRLAPEHKFPIGWQDSYDAVSWVCTDEARSLLEIDPGKGFLLGGQSAGANFTAGISHVVRDAGLRYPLTGLAFLAGSFCHPDARPEKYRSRILSIDEIDDAPGLTRRAINYFAEQYGAPPSDKRLSPLLFESHAKIAQKAFFSICGWDPRRDEAILLSQLLEQEGLQVRSHIHAGLPHQFWLTCPDLPVSKAWKRELVEGVEWLLE